jgi:hypothetical protein
MENVFKPEKISDEITEAANVGDKETTTPTAIDNNQWTSDHFKKFYSAVELYKDH